MWKMVNKYYWEINSNIWIFYFRSTWRIKYILEALPKNGKHFNIGTIIVPECPGDLGQVPASVWFTSCFICEEQSWDRHSWRIFLSFLFFFFLFAFSFFLLLLFFFFWLYHMACRILVPQPGTKNLPPLYWKLRVLTTGLPGKSLERFF